LDEELILYRDIAAVLVLLLLLLLLLLEWPLQRIMKLCCF